MLAPVSGAHFNPVVSLAEAFTRRGTDRAAVVGYLPAQLLGGIAGALLANTMFDVGPALASTERASIGTLLAEVVATAGLVLVILGLTRAGRSIPVVATAVGAYIGAAYWFTSSTSFANPAVTVGRIFSDTFAGIEPLSALAFIAAQLVGGAVGVALAALLFPRPVSADADVVVPNPAR